MRKSSWPINLLHAGLHIIPERVTACKYSGHVQNCWKRKHNIRGPVWGISPVRHLYWFITQWLSGKLSRQLPFHLMSRWGQGKQGLRIIQDDRPGVCAYLIGEYSVGWCWHSSLTFFLSQSNVAMFKPRKILLLFNPMACTNNTELLWLTVV